MSGVTDYKLKKTALKAEIKDCIKDRLWQFYAWVKIIRLHVGDEPKMPPVKDANTNDVLSAMVRTFRFEHPNTILCPMCKEYMVIDGFRCFGCGCDIDKYKRE